jgi:AcrR family transcriptional regulator
MARPVNADGDATRKRILDRAVALFAERGSDGVSTRELSAAAGVSLAMVNHYFGSKDALYVACVDSMYAELSLLRDELNGALALGGSIHELIERAMRAGFRFVRAHQTAVRLGLRAVVAAGELDEARRTAVQLPFLAQVSELLGAALGRPAQELRLPLQSLVSLAARYGVSSDRELASFTGLPARRALGAVEDHLVATAKRLLEK